jgi:hypothetical protein
MCVCNKDRSPARIHGCNTAPTETGFAEIVSDYFPNASSCRAYADEEFGPEALQMQAFRLRLLTFAGSSRLMATAQASSPLRSDQVLCPVSGLDFPPVSELVLRPTLG